MTRNSIAVLAAFLALSAAGMADTIQLRETGDAGAGITDASFSDTYNNPNQGGANDGDRDTLRLRYLNGPSLNYYTVLAVTDLFTLLPASSGGDPIQIASATLTLTRRDTGTTDADVRIRRLTTGFNANDLLVTHDETDTGAGTGWSGDSPFSIAKDTTDVGKVTGVLGDPDGNSDWGVKYSFDVTTIVSDFYATGTNYGFQIEGGDNDLGAIYAIGSSENSASAQPVLTIVYSYIPEPMTFALLAVGAGGLLRRKR